LIKLIIQKASFFLHKTATKLDKIYLHWDEDFSQENNIKVHPSSKCNLSNILLKNGCSVNIHEQTQVGGSIIFDKENASISIGKRGFISGSIIIAQNVKIGDDVLISWGTTIVDHNSHSISFSYREKDAIDWLVAKKDWSYVKILPVEICNKVWIGFNSIILKGVTIGEGAVVGAGSVVTKDVPPWTIVAGNPARVIREIPEDER
jgi:acetyltransferase-like isoleucine patch superfamily enzyme